jgi:hypothetical protein
MGTGHVPGLNTERIYTTNIPAEELAQALADHFRAQGFEAQVFRTSGDRTAMQARKESLWRHVLGVSYALTVVFAPGEGKLSIGLGGHEWVDAAVSGAIGLVAVPPVLLGTAYGIWKENQLDKEVWQVIDERVNAPAKAGPLASPATDGDQPGVALFREDRHPPIRITLQATPRGRSRRRTGPGRLRRRHAIRHCPPAGGDWRERPRR